MAGLKETLRKKIEAYRPRVKRLQREFDDVVVDTVTVGKILGGMRSLKCLVTDISYLDPNEGIRYRGFTLPEVFEKLPKPHGAEMPYVEGLWYLLLTGDMPDQENVDEVIEEFQKRRILPRAVYEVIDSSPCCAHPMTIFASAILALHRESFFVKKYNAGISKNEYWDPMYEDAMNLLAKLPEKCCLLYLI